MTQLQRVLVGLLCIAGVITAGVIWHAYRPVTGPPTAPTEAVYYCPMHPAYTSNRPGDCPICNMKLVERKAASPVPLPPAPASPNNICYMHNCPMVHEGTSCPMLVIATPGEEVTCPVCGTHVTGQMARDGERRILYWIDPMMPGVTADAPGTSPMGMALVPVYEEAAGPTPTAATTPPGYARILVTPHKQQLIGVKTTLVEKRPVVKTVRAVGTVAHDPELYQTQAELVEAMRAWQRLPQDASADARAAAQRLVELSRVRLKHLGWNDALIDEMLTRHQPDHSLLFGGAGGRVWIYASIYEYELPLVHIGDQVDVDVPSLGPPALIGQVRSVDPMLDEATRTARVRIVVNDADGRLKPDMFVNAIIQVDLGEVSVVPSAAVLHTGTRQIIFIDQGQGVFEPRDIRTGVTVGDIVEVQSGVTVGERVVVSGNFLIDSESRLKGALDGMSDAGHQHGQ